MKKVQDFYFKKAKKDKYPARSVYKLEEAQKKHRFLKPGSKVLDLGCHPGGWSLYAAKIVGRQGLVVGADLQKTKKVDMAGAARMVFLQTDISGTGFLESIRDNIPFDGVISDLAPKTTGHKFSDHLRSIELSRQALAIAVRVLRQGGFFYCKVFQGEDFPVFVDEVRRFFGRTKIVKPKSSRSESREIFVLGLSYSKEQVVEEKDAPGDI